MYRHNWQSCTSSLNKLTYSELHDKIYSIFLSFQDCKKFISSENFHGGSLDTTDSNNIIELINFSEFGPKASGDFGSMDSSDTFLSCNTHPFPSQGSLAGLEALAAQGSMAPNGSLINNTVYVNPFDPAQGRRNGKNNNSAVTPSPRGSPQRRVRIAARSRSSDMAELDCMDRETSMDEIQPKHRRARISQVSRIIIYGYIPHSFALPLPTVYIYTFRATFSLQDPKDVRPSRAPPSADCLNFYLPLFLPCEFTPTWSLLRFIIIVLSCRLKHDPVIVQIYISLPFLKFTTNLYLIQFCLWMVMTALPSYYLEKTAKWTFRHATKSIFDSSPPFWHFPLRPPVHTYWKLSDQKR